MKSSKKLFSLEKRFSKKRWARQDVFDFFLFYV